MTETEPLLLEERDRVLVLTLNRPARRNAIDLDLATQIAAAMDELDAREDLAVGILTGTGAAFCAGMDLKAFSSGEVPVLPDRGFAGLVDSRPNKPLIAAVNGFALAGGLELVLSCDLVVAAETATFGLPEVKRGLCAAAGGLMRLRERLPYHLAMEMILTGDSIDAPEALRLGLVNQVVSTDEVLPAALRLAERIARNAPLALAASKRVFIESADWPDHYKFPLQEQYVAAVRSSQDAAEGARAFVEKRAPLWRGC
jgi:enoyl-CoA hydratase